MIRRLSTDDISALRALREESLRAAPWAFGSTVEDDRFRSAGFARTILLQPEQQAVFGAEVDGKMVGIAGVFLGQRSKDVHIASLWGMYVAPAARGRGAAAQLVQATIDTSRAWGARQLQLAVSDGAQGAVRLYERCGFERWGTEPEALFWDGTYHDCHHYRMRL
jgi:RimJ/RimL family protein N-acetyltransferase